MHETRIQKLWKHAQRDLLKMKLPLCNWIDVGLYEAAALTKASLKKHFVSDFRTCYTNVTLGVDAAQSTVNDSWFIGAFGRWWRGGTIRAWWHGALIDQKDAERLNSGILDLKALDSLESYDGA